MLRMDSQSGIEVYSCTCGGCGYFVLFVMACIALSHSQFDDAYTRACGRELWNCVLSDVLMPILTFPCTCSFTRMIESKQALEQTLKTWCGYFLLLFFCIGYFVMCFCLSYFTITASQDAMQNSTCTSVLSNEIKNINTPVLAYIGYTYGIIYALMTAGFFIFSTILAMMGCCCPPGSSHI